MMGIIKELGAVAVLVPILLVVFLAVGIILILISLFRNVPALQRLRRPILTLGALAATAVVSIGFTFYLTRLALGEEGAIEGLRLAEKVIEEKTSLIEEQRDKLGALSADREKFLRTIKTQQDELAVLRAKTATLEEQTLRYRDEVVKARRRPETILKYVNKDAIAPIVGKDGMLSDEDVKRISDIELRIVRPRLRSVRIEASCPMKYVTPGATFALKAGKETLSPGLIEFDAESWRVNLAFYEGATAEDAMRFTHSDECTLTAENQPNPCHLVAVFKRGATDDGWLSSTTTFSLTRLEIGAARITRTADGWRAETVQPEKAGVFSRFIKGIRDSF